MLQRKDDMEYIIDRFEGDMAVCETSSGSSVNLPKKLISSDAKEGDVLIKCGEIFIIDKDKTRQRRNKILQLQRRISKKSNNLDF